MFKNVPPAALALGLSAVSTLLAWPALAQNHQHRAMPMPAAAPAAKAARLPLTASGAVIVAVPPSIKETSAFMTLRNPTAKPVLVTNVSAAVAPSAMLMHTLKTQNMSGMVMAPSLVVPAHGTLVLRPDGDHVMLSSLKRPLKVGEVLPLVLSDGAGRTLQVGATVKKP